MTELRRLTAFVRDHLKRGFKYACVGTSGFLIDVLLLYCLTQYAHIWYILSEVIATLVTFVTNYFFNTFWTYRDAMKKLESSRQERAKDGEKGQALSQNACAQDGFVIAARISNATSSSIQLIKYSSSIESSARAK